MSASTGRPRLPLDRDLIEGTRGELQSTLVQLCANVDCSLERKEVLSHAVTVAQALELIDEMARTLIRSGGCRWRGTRIRTETTGEQRRCSHRSSKPTEAALGLTHHGTQSQDLDARDLRIRALGQRRGAAPAGQGLE